MPYLQDKKKNTLAPVWQERKFLMVQEPTTQFLRLEMFDWDRINAKELLTLNLVKVSMGNTQKCLQSLTFEDHVCSGCGPCLHLLALEL